MGHDNFIKETEFRNRQRIIDKKFEAEGLSDEVLELQVALNEDRHEFDISDSTKRVNENYVQ